MSAWSFESQSITIQLLTLVRRSLSCCGKKAADSLWTDDKVLQRRVQSWGLLSCRDSRCLLVYLAFSVASSPRSDPAQPPMAPGLKRVASDQGWLTTSVRENYLHHEWTCLFGEMAP